MRRPTLSSLCSRFAASFIAARAATLYVPSLFVVSILIGAGPLPSSSAQTFDYEIDRDNVEGPWVNLNFPSVRPMVVTSALGGRKLFAVNTHDSTVEYFGIEATSHVPAEMTPLKVWGVPWGPVSIAFWQNVSSPRLVVVCRGSNVLVQMDPITGKILAMVHLAKDQTVPPANDVVASEPADLLIVGDKAYVACSGTDAVVEVDLVLNKRLRAWNTWDTPNLRIKTPFFVSYDVTLDRLLVAPLTSGNKSTTDFNASNEQIVTSTSQWVSGLPDEDLFAISLATGNASVVANGNGTIQFAHGIHPNGNLWQLNTEAVNDNAAKQSEPKLKGVFAKNRLTIATPPAPGAPTFANQAFLSLDGIGSSGNVYVGQPYALAFENTSPTSKAYVSGLLTDNVVTLDSNGGFVKEWSLPDGSIPRGIVVEQAASTFVYVYCWGTNKILAYDAQSTGTVFNTYALNHDPTPASVKLGREIFYDGDRSKNGNLSCATCHVEGRADLLAWNLSNLPMDKKGPMVTQTLTGIERLAPFHWRGERPGLADFNGAFESLLGASSKLDETTELPAFEDFVFSMQNPANPFQNRDRVLDDSIEMPGHAAGVVAGNQDGGQEIFLTTLSMGGNTCATCHAAPSGTSNDIFQVVSKPKQPERSFLKPTPFHELWRKNMPTITVQQRTTSPQETVPFLGFGFAHDGESADLFAFIDAFQLTTENLTAFVHQWDQGLAPAVHFGFLLDSASVGSGQQEIGYLETQALRQILNHSPSGAHIRRRFCDIAVVGQTWSSGNLLSRRWAWDPQLAMYRCEDPTIPNRSLSAFLSGVSNGESNVFLGLPNGTAERFAIDYDADGLLNLSTSEPDKYVPNAPSGTPTTPSFVFAPNLTFKTARVARIAWETDEPCIAQVEYWETSAPGTVYVTALDGYCKTHSVVLSRLRPSTPDHTANGAEYFPETVNYSYRVTVTNRWGNSDVRVSQDLTTSNFIVKGQPGQAPNPIWLRHSVVGAIEEEPQAGQGIQYDSQNNEWVVTISATAALRRGIQAPGVSLPAPAAGRAMAFTIFHHTPTGAWTEVPLNDVVLPQSGPNYVPPVTVGALQLKVWNQAQTQWLPSTIMSAGTQFVIAPLTLSNGQTPTFSFRVKNLTAGGELMIYARAIVQIPSANGGLTEYQTQSTTGAFYIYADSKDDFLQYSFPETTEEGASLKLTIP